MRAECFRHSRRSRGRATRQRFRCTSGARVARYYDPATAQFLTRDPIEQLTQQPYQYSNDGPLDFTDPTGLFGWGSIAHAAAWVAVGAGVVAVAAVTVAAAPVAIPIEASVLATTASVAGGTALAASLVETGAACYDAATGGSISGRECAVDAASTVAAGAAGVSADEAYKVVSGAGVIVSAALDTALRGATNVADRQRQPQPQCPGPLVPIPGTHLRSGNLW